LTSGAAEAEMDVRPGELVNDDEDARTARIPETIGLRKNFIPFFGS
jgi:hypothetical protein